MCSSVHTAEPVLWQHSALAMKQEIDLRVPGASLVVLMGCGPGKMVIEGFLEKVLELRQKQKEMGCLGTAACRAW